MEIDHAPIPLPYLDPWEYVVDHVIPLAQGGEDELPNKQAAHRCCNRDKSDKLDRLNAGILEAERAETAALEEDRGKLTRQLEAGQPLAVVEAMKMENILRAEKSATVKVVNAKAGDSLAVDAIILELE